jgi:hypothetical protein
LSSPDFWIPGLGGWPPFLPENQAVFNQAARERSVADILDPVRRHEKMP